jgi:predicted nucleic acid-binding protein
VADCNVIAKWELPAEEGTPQALELPEDWEAGAITLRCPDLLPSEIGSTFLRAVRRQRITEEEAAASIQTLLAVDYDLQPSSPHVQRAFQIAQRHNQRIYDCFYVALAEAEGIDFWTGDRRLYNALSVHFPFVRLLTDYTPLR